VQISGDPPMRLLLTFQEAFPQSDPVWVLQAPGRDMWVAACPADDTLFSLVAPDLDAHTSFNYRSAESHSTVLNRPLPAWALYPAGVLMLLREAGLEMNGLQAVLAGREPAGPRYLHALGVVVASLCYESQGQTYQAEDLIDLVEQVRRAYVET
jgi:galactokinase